MTVQFTTIEICTFCNKYIYMVGKNILRRHMERGFKVVPSSYIKAVSNLQVYSDLIHEYQNELECTKEEAWEALEADMKSLGFSSRYSSYDSFRTTFRSYYFSRTGQK